LGNLGIEGFRDLGIEDFMGRRCTQILMIKEE
jgi:hypothetical protein